MTFEFGIIEFQVGGCPIDFIVSQSPNLLYKVGLPQDLSLAYGYCSFDLNFKVEKKNNPLVWLSMILIHAILL